MNQMDEQTNPVSIRPTTSQKSTLIELLVTIAIIAVLIGDPKY